MNRDDFLFSNQQWSAVERHQKEQLAQEIATIPAEQLLNTPISDLSRSLAEKYRIDVPNLDRENIVADQREVQIDVSQDQMRYVSDRTRPFNVPGTQVEITVPFSGSSGAFNIQPTSFSLNPPRGRVEGSQLRLYFEGTRLNKDQLKNDVERLLESVEHQLDNLRANVDPYNIELENYSRQLIEGRREKLLANQDLVASLGFKLKNRKDSPRTYAAPEIRRKLATPKPIPGRSPSKAEPILIDTDYEHILNVIENMALVIERSPKAFSKMNEESVRFLFLVPLNGHYEGQATGETFNYEGKTDILIRVDGKNIFIAECKFWKGSKSLSSTIDQILRYSSWRDTKVAIVIFNRNKDFSKVLESIRTTAKAHPNFKRELRPRSESSFQFVFVHRDDPDRELVISILAFEVPK